MRKVLTKNKIFIGKEKRGGGLGRAVAVQVAPQGRGVIGHDAGGPQAVGRFKIRLFVQAPEYHLGVGGETGLFHSLAWNATSTQLVSAPLGAGLPVVPFSEVFQIGLEHSHC